jgi:hypothetical protein
MALPQHEWLFRRAPLVCIETALNPPEQVYQSLVTTALLCGKTCELSLLAKDVGPAEILAKQEGGVDYQAVLIIRRAV